MGEVSEQTWTIGRLLDWTTAWFKEHGVEGGRLAAELLLARALGCRKIELYTRYTDEPTAEQRAAFKELVKQAGAHVPIAYLLGSREFFSLEFDVTPAVLIPRPETEALVQRAIAICRTQPEKVWQVLDLGTGTGCIAAALAKYAKNTMLTASDVSAEALAVAAENITKHGLSDRIRLVEADAATLPADIIPPGGFDLIVTNPPYISDTDWIALPPNVREHEPQRALYGGPDGLNFYRRLAAEAGSLLAPGGRLLAEIAAGRLPAVTEVFTTAGWTFLGSHRDRTDPHERVVEVQRN